MTFLKELFASIYEPFFGLNEMDYELHEVEVVDVGKEDVLLPRVGLELHKVLDEVEQGLDEILGEGSFQKQSQTYDATQSDYGGNDEDVTNVEFNDGKDDGVLVDKVKLDAEQITLMLEAGYNMEEIEGMEGVELELDDMPPLELDMEDVLDHPSDNDDDAIINDVDGVVDDAIIEVDDGGEQEEGGDDGHLGDDEGEQEEGGDDDPSDNDDDAIINDVDGVVDDAIIEVDDGGEQEEGGDDGHLGDDEA
ncbi:unnamed protein product [Lactuca virosa]|uniref:Uncharacterized protein n=1 Tax=Lactuca virosa TaxID=75947 RepID=A0AAU9LP09_9ASTR|nr:unnamed protein product [Lactuca virosa]